MKRITVSLSDEVSAALAREARRRGVSGSTITRCALASHLGVIDDKPRDVPFAAVGRSGSLRSARDMEKSIGRDWDKPSRSR